MKFIRYKFFSNNNIISFELYRIVYWWIPLSVHPYAKYLGLWSFIVHLTFIGIILHQWKMIAWNQLKLPMFSINWIHDKHMLLKRECLFNWLWYCYIMSNLIAWLSGSDIDSAPNDFLQIRSLYCRVLYF